MFLIVILDFQFTIYLLSSIFTIEIDYKLKKN